ncbi:ligand-binding sensor domain-containing diguanylate cyclase [Alteromonas sp. C1M14]|uniref:ligand-binding sensor domain-containing diguanylate cyclase n=1 Tax=Alteromonas sp. C1M14 TaxID=2841567 RepID=UPI001C08C77E|nr:ligand-binding sensor domain-containing diguanylate cyclase [Alteromonas sp. C1M14]MBU2979408.1 diguanylate cyclase [Alteromonas sp. C1M14]
MGQTLPYDVANQQQQVIPYSVYHQRLWDTRDNMPQISAVSITQDKTGYMWVATEGGLTRFDGDHFRNFNSEDTPALSDPILRTVYVDELNQLWIGSTNGLIVKRDSAFIEPDFGFQSPGKIEDIVEFNQRIYIAANGLFSVDRTSLAVDAIEMNRGQVTALARQGDKLWVAFNNALGVIDSEGQYQFIKLQGQPQQSQIEHLTDYNGSLVVGTTRGVFRLSDEGQLTPALFSGNPITDGVEMLYADSKGNLWIACKQRLIQIHGNEIIEEVTSIDDKTLPWFVTAFEDHQGNLWFGSRTHGLQRLRYDGSRNFGVEAGLAEPYVWTFANQQDHVLVGTNGGLYQFKQGRFTLLVNDDRLPNNVVYTLFIDSKGNIWAGTRAGAVQLTSDYQVIQQFPSLQNYQINGFTETADGAIWIATLKGLYRWDGHQLTNQSEQLQLTSDNTRAVFTDSAGQLWIGTAAGAYKYANGKLNAFTEDRILHSTSISFFTQLKDKRMIIGTLQAGFAIEHDGNWYWPQIDKLPAENLLYAAEYDGSLVVSNVKGVYKVALASLAPNTPLDIRVLVDDYGPEANRDGIRCCNGAGNAKGTLKDGILYLPTLNGVGVINLAQAIDAVSEPIPVIEGMVIDNRWYTQSGATLPLGKRNARFEFSSPKFYRNSALRFRYFLDGYDANWTGTISRREGYYTNLPPGEYQFKVQTRMQEQSAWSTPTVYHVVVPAYWYEQNWMRVVFVCIGVLVIWGLIQLRMRRLERSKARLESMVAARTRQLDNANKKLAEANKQLENASLTDSLTGLRNRRYLDVYIDNILARSKRLEQGIFCIILDIDNFKILNDQLGHSVGDDILVAFSDILRREVRHSDHIVRWGGEEFLILLDAGVSVAEFMERLMSAIAHTDWPHGSRLPTKPSCSAGVCYHHSGLTNWHWEHSLILADKAMYLAKRGGKAGWLHMQPKADVPEDLRTDVTTCSAEALLCSNYFDLQGSEHIMSSAAQIKGVTPT